LPGWGSWEWVGGDLVAELSKYYRTISFDVPPLPDADILVLVKHPGSPANLPSRSKILFIPIDAYGGAAEIDADGDLLRRCSRILLHCERLRRYFEPYARVELIDHHVKFAASLQHGYRACGYFLWVGVRTNLGPMVDWVNQHPLPGELYVLTNLEDPNKVPAPEEVGFRQDRPVRIEHWTHKRHLELAAKARAAIDIKGDDFRSRHKPPAKAIDFIASGLPLAMNRDSSPVEHLARMGFDVASPLDTERWLSRAYWDETQRFGAALRELLSLERIGRRYRRIIEEVLAERQA
jgi:hypothetical protein